MDTWITISAILSMVCIGILVIISSGVPEETLVVNIYDLASNLTIQNVNVVLKDLDTGKTMEKVLASGGTFPVTANHSYQYRVSKEGYTNRTGTLTLDQSSPYSLIIRLWGPIPLKSVEFRPSGAVTVKIDRHNSTQTMIPSP
jgi:hypothetical protein